MNRMPCSITDGPQYDDDEMFPPKPEPNPDDQYDEWRESQERNPETNRLEPLENDFLFNALKSSMEPLITAHAGDKQ